MEILATMKLKLGLFIISMGYLCANAQFFAGLGTDPNNTIYSLNLQPANIINGTHKWQLTLPGVDFTYRKLTVGNNENPVNSALDIDVKRLFDFTKNNSSQLFANLIIPGITYSPSDKHIFGFSLGLRGYSFSETSSSQVSDFLLSIIDTGQVPAEFSLAGGYTKAFINTWFEAKFNYARVVYDKGRHRLTAGGAFKFLGGTASGFVEFDELQVEGGTNGIENLQANFRLVYNRELDVLAESNELEVDLFNRSSTGLDLGVNYVLYDDPSDKLTDNYRLSAGFSVIDIGSMKYSPSVNSADYRLNGQDVTFTFLQTVNSVDEFLDSLENQVDFSSETESDYRLSLPTRYTLGLDYRLLDPVWISVMTNYYPIADNVFTRESSLFNILLTPRFKWRKLTFFVPMYASTEIRNLYGLTMQYRFLSLGSANFWNIITNDDRNVFNLFLSLSFKFNKKG